ncbi:MAG: ribonuclease III [Actinobacteria bacterium]|nr:ribonuclease III [Actinomycetota bacterium]
MAKSNKQDQLLTQFEATLGLEFENKALLALAFTHSSYAFTKSQAKRGNNERLEFLGDAVLKLIVSDYFYEKYPDYTEGDLTKLRAQIISDKCFSQLAQHLQLGEYTLLSYSERKSGGKLKESILASTFEALFGAYFLDQGYLKSKELLLKLIEEIDLSQIQEDLHDFKGILQEKMQKAKSPLPQYQVIKEEGPDHDKEFEVNVCVEWKGQTINATAVAVSKKEAEKKAAKALLDQIESPKNMKKA